jgi:hypothetical protein
MYREEFIVVCKGKIMRGTMRCTDDKKPRSSRYKKDYITNQNEDQPTIRPADHSLHPFETGITAVHSDHRHNAPASHSVLLRAELAVEAHRDVRCSRTDDQA